MKIYYFITLLLFSLSLAEDDWSTQYYSGYLEEVGANWSDEAKTTFYLAERISPELALLYQTMSFLPFMNLGYAYSDNYAEGLKLDLISLLAIWLAYTAEDSSSSTYDDDGYYVENDGGSTLISGLGLFTFYAINFYKYYDAYQKAEIYNNNLYIL